MTELRFIPQWLGEWADRNPNFRNFPVFAALSALLLFVWSLFARGNGSDVSMSAFPRFSIWRRAAVCAVCTGLLGIVLELAQILMPGRVADPRDVLWMTAGAFVGALAACYVSKAFVLPSGLAVAS